MSMFVVHRDSGTFMALNEVDLVTVPDADADEWVFAMQNEDTGHAQSFECASEPILDRIHDAEDWETESNGDRASCVYCGASVSDNMAMTAEQLIEDYVDRLDNLRSRWDSARNDFLHDRDERRADLTAIADAAWKEGRKEGNPIDRITIDGLTKLYEEANNLIFALQDENTRLRNATPERDTTTDR